MAPAIQLQHFGILVNVTACVLQLLPGTKDQAPEKAK